VEQEHVAHRRVREGVAEQAARGEEVGRGGGGPRDYGCSKASVYCTGLGLGFRV
jgi:hypothetical protein